MTLLRPKLSKNFSGNLKKKTRPFRASSHHSGGREGHREGVSPQQKDHPRACRRHLEYARVEVPAGARVQTSPGHQTQKIKFAGAVMGYWGLEEGISTVYTYDEDDFKKISGLQVRKP